MFKGSNFRKLLYLKRGSFKASFNKNQVTYKDFAGKKIIFFLEYGVEGSQDFVPIPEKCPEPGEKLQMGFKSIMRIDESVSISK